MNAPLAAASLPVAQDVLWYKDAIIYQLHVKSFFDSDNDGIGDFPGLISKLDYIAELGVNTLWLLPFYPSPRLDDGYDIAEYTAVHPEYGTLDDVKRFIEEAHRRGIRVITELVINHTSDQHAWFQRARQAPAGSPERNFYVWSDDDQKYGGTRIIFVDTQRSNWTWDPVANAYYWHRFYAHQPDLNFDNPEVLKAVLRIMHFWLDMGVDGLRLDAVPYLMEREGTNNENLPETHDVLKRIRADLDASYPGRMLLAEANQWPEDTKEYFGQGDECHMAFHFPLMPRMYMALAREDRFPITDIMRQTPQIPDNCQWAIFLRNHDELTLEMVTDSERDYLWQTYATDRRARLNLGIRRRLAPLLERDRRRIELMNSLLFSMPGAPVIYYGDELGMGDNIRLGDRDGVRTPMQWSPDRNGGFSRADPAALALPVIMDALYGYETINAEAQTRDAHSLLHWMRRMLAIRRQHAAFGRGALRFLYPKNRKVLAYLRELDDEVILCVANVSHTPQAVELDLSDFNGRVPVELTGGSLFPPVGKLTYLLTLPPFGFYWFILTSESESPSWHTPAPEPMPDYVTVVLRNRLDEALEAAAPILERETLPPYLQKRRWFGAKDQILQSSHIAYTARLGGELDVLLAEVEVKTDGKTSRWQLPLSMCWEDEPSAALPSQLALARVRRGRRVGLLTDAFSLPVFARQMLASLADAQRIDTPEGQIVFEPAPDKIEVLRRPADAPVMWLTAEQSNSSLIVDDAVMLKIFRRIGAGEHPEAEMGRYLTANNFANAPALLGEVSRIDAQGQRHALAVAQAFVRNQGDAWTWALNQVNRAFDATASREASAESRGDDIKDYHALAAAIGRQLGIMHTVLARPTDDPAFAPRTAGREDVAAWIERAMELLSQAFDAIGARKDWDNETAEAYARTLLAGREPLEQALRRLGESGEGTPMTRIHGDFHLGQVLVASADAYIIDFEGEPARPLAERRGKASPLRDVAGLLRSIDYAAATALDPKNVIASRVSPGRRQRLIARLREGAGKAFLGGYREATGSAGKKDGRLLDFFLIEKAAYEVNYEAANRPAWLAIPVGGLARIANRLLAGAGCLLVTAAALTRLDRADAEALAMARHRDAFGVLGPHDGPAGRIIRVFLPGAQSVDVLRRGDRTPLGRLREDEVPGLFEGPVSAGSPYLLRIQWPAAVQETEDPYSFGPLLGELDLHLFNEGRHFKLAEALGANLVTVDGVQGVRFAVWAPNAERVAVIGDFNAWDARRHPMRLRFPSGIWELFVPRLDAGARYKFDIVGAGGLRLPAKADPVAQQAEPAPATASVVASPFAWRWSDQRWMAGRAARQSASAPLSIYEAHIGSWMRPADGDRGSLWDLATERLIPYLADLGFTHLELLPITEHPFGGSWGYQPLGLFAPSARFGPPEAFARFVDALHAANIGVILDWVPAHFPTDPHGLARFDGTALYEYLDPREGFHRDWNTYIYNFGRHEVQGFLIASALHWLERYHVDGLRVDAVASMLYRDYSRPADAWIPNVHGGRENLEAVGFLRHLNAVVAERCPGAVVVAEESTAWPGVTAPLPDGLGFSFKWNMGWMHDTLRYIEHEPIHRAYHHDDMTFGLLYAFSEKFILPISHDEVVYGKGSLLGKMPGDRWQRFANLRAYLGFMWAHPGKKLLFMGSEIAQAREWNHDGELDWPLLGDPMHAGIQRLVGDLNRLYAGEPSLHQRDCLASGFRWLIGDDRANSVFAFLRLGEAGSAPVLVVCNMTPVPRHGYRIGVPRAGRWREIANTDSRFYGGSDLGNDGAVHALEQPSHGEAHSVLLTLPPLSTVMLRAEG